MGLFPFQLAARTSNRNPNQMLAGSCVEFTYELLRKNPPGAVLATTLMPEFTSVLDEPDFQHFCRHMMALAQLEREQELDYTELEPRQAVGAL
jgi:hypothetical protein